jgi:hypothetical protein
MINIRGLTKYFSIHYELGDNFHIISYDVQLGRRYKYQINTIIVKIQRYDTIESEIYIIDVKLYENFMILNRINKLNQIKIKINEN